MNKPSMREVTRPSRVGYDTFGAMQISMRTRVVGDREYVEQPTKDGDSRLTEVQFVSSAVFPARLILTGVTWVPGVSAPFMELSEPDKNRKHYMHISLFERQMLPMVQVPIQGHFTYRLLGKDMVTLDKVDEKHARRMSKSPISQGYKPAYSFRKGTTSG